MNISKIAGAIQKYKDINPQFKYKADKKISEAYEKIYKLYNNKYENDEELNKDVEVYNKLIKESSYSIETDPLFEESTPGGEDELDDTSFSPYKHWKIKEIYETWPKEKERIQAKIDELNKVRKFIPFYKSREKIYLEAGLRGVEYYYNGFKKSLEKIKKRDEFLKENQPLIDELKASIDKRLKKYAKEAIDAEIDEYPYVACEKMSVREEPVILDYFSDILHKEINKIHDQAQKELDEALECGL